MPLYRSGLSGSGASLSTTGNLGLGGVTPTYGIEVLGGDIKLDALATPGQPTVSVNGTPGSTTFYYYIIAEDRNGYQTPPGPASVAVTTSQASPNINNTVSWTAVSGAAKYYVLRYTSGTLPAAPASLTFVAATLSSVALSGTTLQVIDTTITANLANITTAFRNTTGDIYVDGVISCKGNSVGALNEVFGANAYISSTSPQNTIVGNTSRQIGSTGGCTLGYNTQANGSCVAIGVSASATGSGSIAIGLSATAATSSTVAVGQGAQANAAGGVAVGIAANASGLNSVCLGNSATVTTGCTGSIALGALSSVSTTNSMVIGSDTYPISKVTLGKGESVTTTMPASVTFTLTAPSGLTNTTGTDMIITGGKGSGTGAGGVIRLQTAPPGAASGTTVGTLAERAQIDSYGNVILNSGGAALATTATFGFTYIPSCTSTAAGTPVNLPTGAAPMVFDTGNNFLWIYNPTGTAAWKKVALT